MAEEISTIDYIEDENRWSLWPVLPMKRRTESGDREIGFMYAGDHNSIWIGNIYCASDVVADPANKRVFTCPEDIAAAGWQID